MQALADDLLASGTGLSTIRTNTQAITAYLGHSIQTTLDLYGHLMPGNEEEAVALVDAYFERTDMGSPSLEPANS